MPMARVCTHCGKNVENAPLVRVCSICDGRMDEAGYQIPTADALLDNRGAGVGGEQIDICPTCAKERLSDVWQRLTEAARSALPGARE